ncbi:MAG: cytochrome c [Chloroflexi bacterium]|uniref:Cytochrome c n=1 Tax=Candidatus Chlorohelix allophototropha TaxID=3003348 RepID=A0A8T7M6U4_9CHLR|nr:cytochrome c [Chloroflexota bacterium]WJW69774.1 cytochrome c [Chloroflexota bacterium L227-S17]
MKRQKSINFLLAGLFCWLLLAACSDEATQTPAPTTTVSNTQAVVNITPIATTGAATATLPLLTQTTATTTTAATTTTTSTTTVAVTTATTPPVSKPTATATVAVTTISVVGSTAAERGKNLFILVGCAACHGPTAQGAYGPKIAATKLSYAEVLMQVRNPRPTTGNSMIPFRQEEVPDSQVADIYAFLQSLN